MSSRYGERKLRGRVFGEMAYLLKEKCTATARAETEVAVLALPPAILEELMRLPRCFSAVSAPGKK